MTRGRRNTIGAPKSTVKKVIVREVVMADE
jgi:hypothetical protein